MFGYKRLDDIFETIRGAEYTPAERLSKLHGVTSRTIRSDVTKINSALEGHGAHIAMKREAGYYLVVDDAEAFAQFTEQARDANLAAPDLTSADERVRFLLRTLLCANDYLGYAELADLVYVGENTLQNYIRQIRDLLAEYDLALIAKAGVGIKVLGREFDRRRCFMENVIVRNMRDYVTGFSKEEETLFPDVDLLLLSKIVRRHLSQSEIMSSDYGFKNLLVHTALMVSRVKAGCEIETTSNIDITPRIQYFLDDTCADLEQAFDISICTAERCYLYLHILSNTTLDGPDINAHLIRNDIDEMLEVVYHSYGFDLRDDAELKSNLMAHLVSTFRSKHLKLNMKNPLLSTIRTNFPLAFEIALASTHKVFDTEPHTLSEDEVGYVALHIGAAIERKAPKDLKRLRIMLVCGSGKSISEMLKSRIETFFGDKVEIAQVVSYRRFTSLSEEALAYLDLVVTTVPLKDCPLPHVMVDFSLTSQDTESISRMINAIGSNHGSKIAKFFDCNLFERMPRATSKGAILERLCQLLEQEQVADGTFIASVLERESVSGTSMGAHFAIPHSMKPISRKTRVAVALLDEPVAWDEKAPEVRIVFLLAVRPGDRENIEHLYDLLLEVANSQRMQQAILDAQDFSNFMAALDTAEQ